MRKFILAFFLSVVFVTPAVSVTVDGRSYTPEIELLDPQDYTITSEDSIVFRGLVQNISKLYINNNLIPIKESRFLYIAPIKNKGANNDFVIRGVGFNRAEIILKRRVFHELPVQKEKIAEPASSEAKSQAINPMKNQYLDKKIERKMTAAAVEALQRMYRNLGLGKYVRDEQVNREVFNQVSKVLIYMRKGFEYYYSGDFEKALELYQAVTQLFPYFHMGYVRLGSIYYQLGDHELARENWKKALDINPENKELKRYIERFESLSEKNAAKVPARTETAKPVPKTKVLPEEEVKKLNVNEELEIIRELDDVLLRMESK